MAVIDEFLNGNLFPFYIDITTPITTDGEDVEVPGDFQLVACLTDNSFDGTTDDISTTSKCSGLFGDGIAGVRNWTMGANGNAIGIQPGDDRINHNILFDLWKNGTTFWGAQFDAGLDTVRYGLMYIASFNEASPTNGARTFTASFRGKGEVYDQTATT